MLPRVRELEKRFPSELVVIGVHAGKYTAERVTANIAAASDRLGIEHAVVNDRQFRTWREYAIEAWPTIAIVDPKGYLVGVQPGEFPTEAIADAIARVIAEAEADGSLVRGPDPIARPQARSSGGVLRYPGRALRSGGDLFVSDTGNGRVLQLALADDPTRATVTAEYGGFEIPQGLARLDGALYVADRGDHSVYRIDRPDAQRTRVVGTGAIAEGRVQSGYADRQPLRSPWGIAADGTGDLLIAMAGSHQLWRYSPSAGEVRVAAGSGGEDLRDGPAPSALLAQPTGICVEGSVAYFADPESSATRVFDMLGNSISTLTGTGLFDFGDRDGVGDEVLMQHNEDVVFHRGALAVADTYNDRIKRVDARSRESCPWPGELGTAGGLSEPSGITSDGERLWVADTNNHRIVSAGSDGIARELEIS